MPAAEWVYRGKSYFARAGGLQLMEPGETHANKKDVYATSFRVLMIPPILMEGAMAELGLRSRGIHLKVAQTYDTTLFAAFHELHASIEQDSSRLEIELRFAKCLRLLGERCLESPAKSNFNQPHSAGVHKAKELLRDGYEKDVSLQELARLAGVSKFHFARCFKRETGLGPFEYRMQRKLSAARDLIRKGHLIAAVAQETGFSDSSHFSRVFKRYSGATPKEFADSVRPISAL
jgi:AraC-like DNA-binding protein